MYINYEGNTIGYLDLTFGPKWDYIPLTKNYIENFLLINLIDKKSISKIAMSASELLENAVKYSSSDGIRMIIKKLGEENRIELFVYNYILKNIAEELLERIEEMKNHEPLDYYIKKMKESVGNKSGQAGLGLARINYEGSAKISAQYLENNSVMEIKALFNI